MAHGRGLFRRLCSLSLCLLLSSGCIEAERPPAPPLPQPPSLTFEELKTRVSAIRGLSFLEEISLQTAKREEIEALLKRSFSEERERPNHSAAARVYSLFGLIPEEMDLPRALWNLHRFERGVHYNRGRKAIFLPQGPLEPSLLLLKFPGRAVQETVRQILLIHALTHALQEQHFRWEQRIKTANTEDLSLAQRSLAKGDALLVGLAHWIGDSKPDRQKIPEVIRALIRSAKELDKDLSFLPEIVRREVSFQYLQGGQFVLWAYSLKGPEGVNSLFRAPPLSTEQILHPEKYYVSRDDPVRIYPWGLTRRLRGEKILDETLGEFLIQALLGAMLPKEEAEKAAAGWAGDSLLAFREGEDLVLAWVTAWDSREDAAEFYRSYRRALERRHGAPLRERSESADTLQSEVEPSLRLQLKENFVFLLQGVPPPRSHEIAEDLWNELDTERQPQQIPFELVRPIPQSTWAGR